MKLPGFAGAVATIAGGAAIGLIVAGVEKWRERQERINEIATEYLTIIQDATDGPLSATNRAYDDLIDKQLVLKSLEELSAAQMADIALLAAARGETVEQYVTGTLTGEVSTQEQLQGIEQARWRIAEETLRITREGTEAEKAQLPILKEQDASLQAQGEALRRQGGIINENVAAYGKAKAAQDNVAKATQASYEKQRALNAAAAAANVDRLVSGLRDAEIRARNTGTAIDNIPRSVSVKVIQSVIRQDNALLNRQGIAD